MKTPGTNANVECFNEEEKHSAKETENMTKNQLEILELKKAIAIRLKCYKWVQEQNGEQGRRVHEFKDRTRDVSHLKSEQQRKMDWKNR